MRKKVELAFAVALFITSVIATVWQTEELIKSLVCAVVVPSFILSFVSFIAEISESCEKNAYSLCKEHTNAAEETLGSIKQYEEDNKDISIEDLSNYVSKKTDEGIDHIVSSITYFDVKIFCDNCKKRCRIMIVIGYVLLFLSLFFAPYLAKWLSNINLNCLTLWSLTLLYLTMELKSSICSYIIKILYKWHNKNLIKTTEKLKKKLKKKHKT